MDSEKGACVAPDCGNETTSTYHDLCDTCRKRVEDAMARARPSLLEMMVSERAEVEAWLASDWAPPRRWVLANEEFLAEPLDETVRRLVEETCPSWDGTVPGFVDDAMYEKWAAWSRSYAPDKPVRPQYAWRVGNDSPAAEAWRAHAAPLLRVALEQALATFPLTWAGQELKAALLQRDDYDWKDADAAIEEGLEGTGSFGDLPPGARRYLLLRYDPDPAYLLSADEPHEHWWKYRVLSDEIMAILNAVRSAESARMGDKAADS